MDLAKNIEHTLLRPDVTSDDIKKLCREAMQHAFAAVCLPPYFIREAQRILGEDSRIRIVTVVGFPMGYTSLSAKSEEIRRALEQGADDIDAVINISAIKSGHWEYINQELDGIARATHMRGKTLKLILECGMLTAEEQQRVCQLAHEQKIAWLKTGTGFHGHPATPEMVRNLRKMAHPSIKIKASGGIRTASEAIALIEAGADHIGTSSGVAMVTKG